MGNGKTISIMSRTMNNTVIITIITIGSELESYFYKFVKEYVRIIIKEQFLHNCLFRDIYSLEEESYSDANPLENRTASGQDILDRNHINL